MNVATPPTTASAQPINFDSLVEKFVRLRDKIKEIKERHDNELKPFNEMKEKLEGLLLNHLNTVGADSVNTAHGTVYRSSKDSASIADMTAFWTWCVTQGNFDYVDRKANVTAVREYIAQTNAAPPGINYSSRYTVGVRRK